MRKCCEVLATDNSRFGVFHAGPFRVHLLSYLTVPDKGPVLRWYLPGVSVKGKRQGYDASQVTSQVTGGSPPQDWHDPQSAPGQPRHSHVSPRAVCWRLGGSRWFRGLWTRHSLTSEPQALQTAQAKSQVSPEDPLVLHSHLIRHPCFISGIWILLLTETLDSKA